MSNWFNDKIVLEADNDITGQIQTEVKDVVGSSSTGLGKNTTNNNNADPHENEDLSNTDNIFGDGGDAAGGGNEDASEDDANDNEDTGDDMGDDAGDAPDVDLGDDPNAEDDQSTDNLPYLDKSLIRDNLIQLYTIITADIRILQDLTKTNNGINSIKVILLVENHFQYCKSFLYKTITKDITKLEYQELLRIYITIKKIYDACAEMLKEQILNSEEYKRMIKKKRKPSKK